MLEEAGIVAACDYTIAYEKAEIKLSELSIGLGPFVIEPAISRKIGSAAFAQLSLEAENWKTAKWAKRKGLYNSVVNSHKELEISAGKLAEKFENYSGDAMKNSGNYIGKILNIGKKLLNRMQKLRLNYF